MDPRQLQEVQEATETGGFKDWLDNQTWSKSSIYGTASSPWASMYFTRDVIYGGGLWKLTKTVTLYHPDNTITAVEFWATYHSWPESQRWYIKSDGNDRFTGFEDN